MNISVNPCPPDGAELLLSGRLDTSTAPAAQEEFLKAAAYGTLTLNCAELEYVSSAGLRALLMLQKQLVRSGGSLTLTHVSPGVMDVFTITGFDSILKIR